MKSVLSGLFIIILAIGGRVFAAEVSFHSELPGNKVNQRYATSTRPVFKCYKTRVSENSGGLSRGKNAKTTWHSQVNQSLSDETLEQRIEGKQKIYKCEKKIRDGGKLVNAESDDSGDDE